MLANSVSQWKHYVPPKTSHLLKIQWHVQRMMHGTSQNTACTDVLKQQVLQC